MTQHEQEQAQEPPTPPKNNQPPRLQLLPPDAIHEIGSPSITPIQIIMTPPQDPDSKTKPAVASTPAATATGSTQSDPPPPPQPSQNPPTDSAAPPPAPATADSKPQVNGTPMPSKPPESQDKPDAAAAAPTAGGPEKLSAAELKKRAKVEKAARRAKVKAEREGEAADAQQQQQGPQTPQAKKGGAPSIKDGATGQSQKQVGGSGKHMRRGSVYGSIHTIEPKKKRTDDKNVAVFGHLYGQPRRTSIAGVGKEVHPAVLALGLQMRDYVICGSNARCIATLLAFKRVSFVSRYCVDDCD